MHIIWTLFYLDLIYHLIEMGEYEHRDKADT